MATPRKSAKRARRKRSTSKRATAKKAPSRKRAARRSTKSRASKKARLKQTARKGLRAARGGMKTVRQAGEKTWEALKSTTAQVVEGVRDRFGESGQEPGRDLS